MAKNLRLFIVRFIPHNRFHAHFTHDTPNAKENLQAYFSKDLDLPTGEIVGECTLRDGHQFLFDVLRRMDHADSLPPKESRWLGCVREYIDDALEAAFPNGDPITNASLRNPGVHERLFTLLADIEGTTSNSSQWVVYVKEISTLATDFVREAIASSAK